MMMCVSVDFLYVSVLMFVWFLCIEKSRKFRVWSLSSSAVNCSFGCRLLKSSRVICMLVWLEAYNSRLSSIYRQ